MTTATAWIGVRLGAAPRDLTEIMAAAVEPFGHRPVAEALAEAACALYGSVLEGPGRRSDALPLLAADALFTHAFEAQAETDPTRLVEFAARWGGCGRLGEVGR